MTARSPALDGFPPIALAAPKLERMQTHVILWAPIGLQLALKTPHGAMFAIEAHQQLACGRPSMAHTGSQRLDRLAWMKLVRSQAG